MPEQQINIKVPDDVLKGTYANNMFVSHNKEEFVLDFINISFFPSPGQGIETAKIITSPGHYKKMLSAMQENLKRYEDQFGKIEEAATPASSEIGFSAEGGSVSGRKTS